MSRSKNEKQNIGTSRSKNEKQNIGTFLQVRCCFVLYVESNRLGPLGLSFILDKAILMAVSWWNLPNKLRWSRFWWTQTCKPVIAAKDGTNKKWGNWSAKVVRKKSNKQGCTNLVNDVYQSSKTCDFTKQLFFPKTPNWGQGASLIRFEFPRSQFRFPGFSYSPRTPLNE